MIYSSFLHAFLTLTFIASGAEVHLVLSHLLKPVLNTILRLFIPNELSDNSLVNFVALLPDIVKSKVSVIEYHIIFGHILFEEKLHLIPGLTRNFLNLVPKILLFFILVDHLHILSLKFVVEQRLTQRLVVLSAR